ncbi:hypothetical protein LP420_26890 [Massilia sp. B-10]|nr:hypothetical protein LP420_26890 [Massilia sp. B-10]
MRTKNGTIKVEASRLILALPRVPLVKLASHLPEHISCHLDSVNGFPMLKIFFVSNAPWWDYDQPPQQYANCLPTREVHYFRRPQENDNDGHGMMMLYMDRPSTEFWRHYLSEPDRHDRAEVDQDARIVDAFCAVRGARYQAFAGKQRDPPAPERALQARVQRTDAGRSDRLYQEVDYYLRYS